MKANAVPVLALFEKKMRLEVPLFQRQYVWSRDDQWEPLWEDIERKFAEYLTGRKDAPVHFLGAMVLDLKQTPSTHVEKRQVIDGQQRLTTLQIFLAAFRDFCRENDCSELAKELESFTLNKGMMAEPTVDQFKVWPTQLDREQFRDVLSLGTRSAVEEKYPVRRQKYARKDDPRPRMVEAYTFFGDCLRSFFLGSADEAPLVGAQSLAARAEEAFQALKSALQVVVIDLEQGDDAQVIFETLNARGEPLLPADLLRNYVFLRAARLGEPADDLYARYWAGFDDEFWRAEVRQGRLVRPRSDLFMQHFLASRQLLDIPVGHLFVEYKFWIERARPFATITEELQTLALQREHFRRLLAPKEGDEVFSLATLLAAFDVSTAYPLLLTLMEQKIARNEWAMISQCLESYLVRRAVTGGTTKNYNRVFVSLTKTLREGGATAANVQSALSALSGDSVAWPTDAEFADAWLTRNAYELKNPRIVEVLRRLGDALTTSQNERLRIESAMTVEHILPQNWLEHWPLPNKTTGLSREEALKAPAGDPLAAASLRRHSLVQTWGNLTIVTQPLNSGVSNGPWRDKKPALLKSSLLPINQALHEHELWDEDAIQARGRALLDAALKLWPGPSST